MQSGKSLTSGQKSIIGQCIAVLRQGVNLIEGLDDEVFSRFESSSKASVGTHFRHNLDFVANLLRGLETGRIDYNLRERDLQVEQNRQYAISRFESAITEFGKLTSEMLEQKILVRSETVEAVWCESSAMRELEFLQSHTIHHYALIEAKLASFGVSVPQDFGVAPSTLEFWTNSSESTLQRAEAA